MFASSSASKPDKERRPRAPEWKPAGTAEISELAVERDEPQALTSPHKA